MKSMIQFIKDFFIYPWDKQKETNKFHHFLTILFKEYPAFLREKPSIWRILLFPFLLIYHIFVHQKKKEK